MEEVGSTIQENLPVAVIFNATCVNQHVIAGDVSTISEKVANAERPGPGITIVGHVVRDILKELPANKKMEYVCFQGTRTENMDKALDIYEAGGWAIIDNRDVEDLHPTQTALLTELMNTTTFTQHL